MTALLNVVVALMAVVATAVTTLAVIAWRRSGQVRTALLAFGFGLVAIAGILTGLGLFSGGEPIDLLTWQSMLVSCGLFVVYVAAVKR
ncbi:MAG: DUF7521 family protein [Thermoplasmatota archaeon]